MTAAIVAFPTKSRPAPMGKERYRELVKSLVIHPYAIAKGLTGDARIICLDEALTAALERYEAIPEDLDQTLDNRCSTGWHRTLMAIATTPATTAAGIYVKLKILEQDLKDNGDSDHRWWMLDSVRRDVRRLLPRTVELRHALPAEQIAEDIAHIKKNWGR